MNNISVFFDHVSDAAKKENKPVSDILPMIRSLGIDMLEISFNDGFAEKAREYKRLFEENGLGVSTFCNDFDLTHDTLDVTKEKCARLFDMAQLFECDKVLCVPGLFDDETYTDKDMDPVVRHLSFICDKARGYGIRVMIEDYDNRRSPCCKTEQMKYLFDRIEDLYCAFDTGNFCYANESNDRAFELFRDRIIHMHCKDRTYRLGDHINITSSEDISGNTLYTVPVGEGDMQIGKYVKLLRDRGYRGAFVIEHYGMDDQLASIRHSVGNLIEFMK